MTKENPTKAPDRVSGGEGSTEVKPKSKTKALVAVGVVLAILLVIAL